MLCSPRHWIPAILASITLPVVAGVASAATGSAAESAIRAVLDAQVEAWNRRDLEGYMAGYWNSPDLVFQSGATTTRGWQATLERYRERYTGEGKEMGRLQFQEVEVQLLGPEAAFVRGRWRLAMKDGTLSGGLFTLVVKRFGRDWRIVHDHTS